MVANSKTLLASLEFGKALNQAFEQFQIEKRRKKNPTMEIMVGKEYTY